MQEKHQIALSEGHLQELYILGILKNPVDLLDLFTEAVKHDRVELALNTLHLEVKTNNFHVMFWEDLADQLNEMPQITSDEQEKEVLELLTMYVSLITLVTRDVQSFLYFLQLIEDKKGEKPEIITPRVKELMNKIVETVAEIRSEFVSKRNFYLGVYSDTLDKLKQFRRID